MTTCVALGLVARVLCAAPDDTVRVAARARLEVRLDGWAFDERQAQRVGDGRGGAPRGDRSPTGRGRARILASADRYLDELHATELAGAQRRADGRSEARLGALAGALDAVLSGDGDLAARPRRSSACSATAARASRSRGSAAMAVRLLRWLQADSAAVAPTISAPRRLATSPNAYADWARTALRHGQRRAASTSSCDGSSAGRRGARAPGGAPSRARSPCGRAHAATDEPCSASRTYSSASSRRSRTQRPVLVVVLDG